MKGLWELLEFRQGGITVDWDAHGIFPREGRVWKGENIRYRTFCFYLIPTLLLSTKGESTLYKKVNKRKYKIEAWKRKKWLI